MQARKVFILISFLVFSFLYFPAYAQNGHAQVLEEASPASVGLSAERLARLDALMQEYLEKKWIPGATAMVVRRGKIVYHKAFGTSGIGSDQPMQKDDLFRIASMTKPITSTAIMMLYEEGKFLLDDPVAKYIPEFKDPEVLATFNPEDSTYTTKPAQNQITIRHLLTHTSGIGYGFTAPQTIGAIYAKAGVPDLAVPMKLTIGNRVKVLAKLPLLHEPGEKWSYGLSTDVLGYLVEVLSGKTLGEFCQERIFEPLGMDDTGFFFPVEMENRLVQMYGETKAGIVEKYTDPKALRPMSFTTQGAKTYYSGGSGLTSTALDYLKFCQMILNQGEYNGQRLLSPQTVALMSMNQIGELGMGSNQVDKFGLGFSISTPASASKNLTPAGRLGWGGAFNTTFWIDPAKEICAVVMTQIYPTQHKELFNKFEVGVYQAVVE